MAIVTISSKKQHHLLLRSTSLLIYKGRVGLERLGRPGKAKRFILRAVSGRETLQQGWDKWRSHCKILPMWPWVSQCELGGREQMQELEQGVLGGSPDDLGGGGEMEVGALVYTPIE